ncbi:hypothetical protein ZIOFF_074819 [Zingiber officinale]|uniref:Fe2OG dioxygenase domain-containing protein n=1 Tax=Zingiber officinale TaxID=94328 RepID=A0A8J5BUK8_ZINOF|nr:hypothetical protein ZIOFF_074819 [Zingiber officinale]
MNHFLLLALFRRFFSNLCAEERERVGDSALVVDRGCEDGSIRVCHPVPHLHHRRHDAGCFPPVVTILEFGKVIWYNFFLNGLAVKPEILSWSPRIILFRNFLTMEECDYLKTIAEPHLQASQVHDTKTGKAVEKRIAIFTQVPQENAEPLYVIRYQPTEYYLIHHDYLPEDALGKGGQRVATMLMYLSNVVEGGETYFPLDLATAAVEGLNGKVDPKSLHSGCPVLKGEKWTATSWMSQVRSSSDHNEHKTKCEGLLEYHEAMDF